MQNAWVCRWLFFILQSFKTNKIKTGNDMANDFIRTDEQRIKDKLIIADLAFNRGLIDGNSYQTLANRTLIPVPDFEITPEQVMISWNALGLVGEAGEVAELVKKGIYHQHGINREAVKKELGDVLWYVAALATEFELSIEEIMKANIAKLRARFPDGYSPDRTKFKQGDAE